MDNKQENNKIENNIQENDKSKNMSKVILNIFLVIVVLITVVTGGIIYYELYKYSGEEIEVSTSSTNEAGTVAEIINTVVETNTTSTSTTNSTTISTSDADSRKVLNEEIIVLYNGLILDVSEMKIVDLQYIDNSNSDKENYIITYYNYENFEFKGSTLGTLSSQVLDGLIKVDNVEKVAISENYDAIPQEIQVINSIPAVVLDNNSDFSDYDTKKTIICDVDGNDTNEYIVILANKSTGESKIVLAESTGFVKATLATMDKSGWESVTTDGYYLSYSNIEVLDIDNDGIMEILFELPTSSTTLEQISLIKYKNGDLTGETDIVCSLVSE